jgi:hypothetical protein
VPFPRTRRYEASSQPTIAEQPVAREREIDAPSIASSRMIKIPPVTAPAEIKATPPPVRKDLTRSKIDKTIETVRTEEPIGEEKRTFDQSRTTASSVETIGLSHTAEWTVTVDASEAQIVGGTGQLTLIGVGSVQGKIEASLTKKYSNSWKTATSRKQETNITVPAGKMVKVIVRWKRIWQEGEVHLRARDGTLVALPFRVTVGLSFDKEIVDIT